MCIRDSSRKAALNSDVVIVMDSNVNFIRLDKVWSTTTKIKTGKLNELLDNIREHDFSNVKLVVIGTGTNDTTEDTALNIFGNLVEGGKEILNNYPNVKVCIAQLPPRKFTDDTNTQTLNNMIKK